MDKKRSLSRLLLFSLVALSILSVIEIPSVVASDDNWEQLADRPLGLIYSNLEYYDGKIFSMGGRNKNGTGGDGSGRYNDVYCYFIENDSWVQKADMLDNRDAGGSGVLTYGGHTYIHYVGGYPGVGYHQRYNISSNTWDTRTALPVSRWDCGGVVAEGYLWIVGGSTDGNAQKTLYMYNPANNSWVQKADMTYGHAKVGCSAYNGKIYAFTSCWPSVSQHQHVEVYDIATNTWSTLSDAPFRFTEATKSAISGKIYLLNGDNKTLWQYNPETDTYTEITETEYTTASSSQLTLVEVGFDVYRFPKFTTPNPSDTPFYRLDLTDILPNFNFKGKYNENSGLLMSPSERVVNVTAYYNDGTPSDTFEVNGTYNYLAVTQNLLYFRFDTSEPREYWLTEDEKELEADLDIYIFDASLTIYIITFLDLAGILEDYSYVMAKRYVDGTLMTVEKRKVDVEQKVVMSLVSGTRYTIIIQGATNYTFVDLTTPSTTTIQLTPRCLDFPKETIPTFLTVEFPPLKIPENLIASSENPMPSHSLLAMPEEYIDYTICRVNGSLWAKVDGTYPLYKMFGAGDVFELNGVEYVVLSDELPLVYPTPPGTTNIIVKMNETELNWSNYTETHLEALHHTAIGDWPMIYCKINHVPDYFILKIHYEHPIPMINGSYTFLYDLNISPYLSPWCLKSTAYFNICMETNYTNLHVYTTGSWNPVNYTITKEDIAEMLSIKIASEYDKPLSGDLVVTFAENSPSSSLPIEYSYAMVAVIVAVATVAGYLLFKRKKSVTATETRVTALKGRRVNGEKTGVSNSFCCGAFVLGSGWSTISVLRYNLTFNS